MTKIGDLHRPAKPSRLNSCVRLPRPTRCGRANPPAIRSRCSSALGLYAPCSAESSVCGAAVAMAVLRQIWARPPLPFGPLAASQSKHDKRRFLSREVACTTSIAPSILAPSGFSPGSGEFSSFRRSNWLTAYGNCPRRSGLGCETLARQASAGSFACPHGTAWPPRKNLRQV